jgi:PBP1b-binding outer membrane lipoprotein LpoB
MKFHYILILLAAFLLIGCNSNQPSANSPSDVLKQYVAASQKQDIATMKSLLSKGSLELIEKSAKAQNTTIEELLRKESSVKIQNAPETRNEKIEGETATVEIKNETNGEFDMKMPFIKETGAWKIARDKYIEEVMKKATEEVNKKLANSTLSNSNSVVNK